MRDLTGQKFGKLTILKILVKRPYSKKSYLCQCDCGKQCIRLESSIVRNLKNTHNCGCETKKNLRPGTSELCSKAGKHRKDSFIDGSNVQMTMRPGTIITNTSGVQGVSWSKTINKWHVYVGWKNYRANLGFYNNLDDAKIIRELAECAIKEGNFEEFYYKIRGKKIQETSEPHIKRRK